jgi:hypothetical protein
MARRKPDGAGFLTKRIKAKLNAPPQPRLWMNHAKCDGGTRTVSWYFAGGDPGDGDTAKQRLETKVVDPSVAKPGDIIMVAPECPADAPTCGLRVILEEGRQVLAEMGIRLTIRAPPQVR